MRGYYRVLHSGGPDGEISASLRYLSQRFTMPNRTTSALLNDIGTEELSHLEMVSTIVHQLTRDLSMEEIEDILVEINDEIGIGLKAGIGVGRNMEDAAYMADLGLEEIRDHDNGMWTWVIEKEY